MVRKWLCWILTSLPLLLNADTLIIGTTSNNQLRFEQEIAASIHAFEQLGDIVQIQSLPAERMNRLFKAGQLDGVFFRNLAFDAHPELNIQVPFPINGDPFFLVVAKHKSPLATHELKGKRMAILRGSPAQQAIAEKYQAIPVPLENIRELILFLESDRADFSAGPKDLHQITTQLGYPLKMTQTILFQEPIYIWLHSKHQGKVAPLTNRLESSFSTDK